MAQNINIAITDNVGKVEKEIEGNFAPIMDIANKQGEAKLPWVTAIDEYGNTYINRTQAPNVIRELELLEVPTKSQQCLNDVINALKNIEPHTLIAFYGD